MQQLIVISYKGLKVSLKIVLLSLSLTKLHSQVRQLRVVILCRARGWMCSRKIVSLPVSLMETDFRQEKNLARWRSSQLLSTLLNFPSVSWEKLIPFLVPSLYRNYDVENVTNSPSLSYHVIFFSTFPSQLFFLYSFLLYFVLHNIFLNMNISTLFCIFVLWGWQRLCILGRGRVVHLTNKKPRPISQTLTSLSP